VTEKHLDPITVKIDNNGSVIIGTLDSTGRARRYRGVIEHRPLHLDAMWSCSTWLICCKAIGHQHQFASDVVEHLRRDLPQGHTKPSASPVTIASPATIPRRNFRHLPMSPRSASSRQLRLGW